MYIKNNKKTYGNYFTLSIDERTKIISIYIKEILNKAYNRKMKKEEVISFLNNETLKFAKEENYELSEIYKLCGEFFKETNRL